MEIDKTEEAIADNEMDFEETNNGKNDDNDDDEEESILFLKVPVQTNQNALVHNTMPANKAYGSSQLHQNYMYQTLLFNQPISLNKRICSDAIRLPKTDELVQLLSEYTGNPVISTASVNDSDKFNYDLDTIMEYKERVELQSNCEWLDCRLEIHRIINDDNVSLDQLMSQLKMSLINVSNDLMIFYHTNSDFALQLIRMESYNLLALLKDPKLEMIILNLPDGFSKLLLKLVKEAKCLEKSGSLLPITIPSIVEILMSNYTILDQKKQSMKTRYHNVPKVVFYSFYAPSHIVMNTDHINVILDKKIISLQRKYFCKVILDGPFLRSIASNLKYEYYRFDIYFDYQFNYWVLVKGELIKWMDSFIRSSFECYIDKVCLSYVTQDFFCCDEIQNLMKRQHLIREIDLNFVKLIKWAKIHQVDRSNL